MIATQAQLDREVSCSRSYLIALQYIAEMVGMDTSDAPPQGAWSVVVAVDAFVKQAGGGRPLDEARARCGEHWLNEQLARDPAISAHERAAAAYYAELERDESAMYCAQCMLNGSGKFKMHDGACPNPRCVLYERGFVERPQWLGATDSRA